MLNSVFGNRPYIIAEVSQNHDGSLGQAHAFIDAVATTGAHAIKFQTHIASEESTVSEPFRVKFSYEDKTRYDYWKRMEFTKEQWAGLYEHARSKGLDFLSSPFSIKALEMLDDIGVPAWKFGSGEVFNSILLDKALETGKPIILSSGLSTIDEIYKQVAKIKKSGNELIVMNCTTSYPCAASEIPLQLITKLKNELNVPIGISDHSSTIYPSLAAVTLGAMFVEVHVTFSKLMFGPDVSSSVTIEQLNEIVEGCDFIFTMLQNHDKKNYLNKDKQELKKIFSKSIYVKGSIKKGELISENNISIKKPYLGIDSSLYYSILGKKVKKDLCNDDPLYLTDLE